MAGVSGGRGAAALHRSRPPLGNKNFPGAPHGAAGGGGDPGDAAGAVVNPSGTADIQPVTVATSAAIPNKGVASTTIVTGGAPDTGVAGGIGLTYSTQGAPLFTARVASNGAGLGGTVDRIDIYWHAID